MTPNPERRNPQRLAREAERAARVATDLQRIADDVAAPSVYDRRFAFLIGQGYTERQAFVVLNQGAVDVTLEYSVGADTLARIAQVEQQEVADALESEGAAGIARDAATDELEALDLEGASFLMLRDFIRPMGVRQ